ncbi:hypothetical protein, partial [Campylobacter armoricus]|uniref:hypothetical protein n=1 Tax=Campylobacter armoricus TaxID=2505970 RepID=UPI001F162974
MFFLVNKDLDDVEFPFPNFRTLYKKHILPEMMKYNTKIFKVPVSYIQENCFHQRIKLSRNIFERVKQSEEIITMFKGTCGE